MNYKYEFIISKLTLTDSTADKSHPFLFMLFPSCRVWWFLFCPIGGSDVFAGGLLLFIGHFLDHPLPLPVPRLIAFLSERWQWCHCWWPAAFYWPPSGPTPPPLPVPRLITFLPDRLQWCLCWWPASFYWPPSGPIPPPLPVPRLIPFLSDRWQWCLYWWPAAFYWPLSGPTPPPLQG